MSDLEKAAHAAKEAKEAYELAHQEYLKAAPGRDLTIKQGHMHECRVLFRDALESFFTEYEKSGVL